MEQTFWRVMPMLKAVKACYRIDALIRAGQGLREQVLFNNADVECLLENAERSKAGVAVRYVHAATAAPVVHQGDRQSKFTRDRPKPGHAGSEVYQHMPFMQDAGISKHLKIKSQPMVQRLPEFRTRIPLIYRTKYVLISHVPLPDATRPPHLRLLGSTARFNIRSHRLFLGNGRRGEPSPQHEQILLRICAEAPSQTDLGKHRW